MSWSIRNFFVSLMNLLLGVITFFLGLRFAFKLLSANPGTPFVAWIYSVSSYLMAPFNGIFGNLSLGQGGVIDIVALISLLAYTIGCYLIITLVDSVTTTRLVDRHFRPTERY